MHCLLLLVTTYCLQLNVGAHKEVSGRSQWADLEKEEEEQELIEESLSEAEISTTSDDESM